MAQQQMRRRRIPLGEAPRELTARMPRAVYAALEAEAASEGLSVNALLNRLVVDHLAPQGADLPPVGEVRN